MLKITKTAEYALIAIKHMSSIESICSSNNIANQYNIPKEIIFQKRYKNYQRKNYIKAIKVQKEDILSKILLRI